MNKKILITSIPCWNQKSGSNTLSSLFETFDSNNLANIYIIQDLPDSPVCSRYFNISEWKVLKSIFSHNTITGNEVKRCKTTTSTSDTGRVHRLTVKRRKLFLWFRELAWKLGNWNSAELDAFLDDFNPEVLVFPIESYPYFNRLNEYIIKRCKPKKVIGYLWDDNFTYKQHPFSVIFKVERYFLRKQVRRLVKSCTDVLAISPKMKSECDAEFGINSVVITKPIISALPYEDNAANYPINVLYTGKLNIGRDQSLLSILDVLENSSYSPEQIQINVYTNTILSDKLKDRFYSSPFCVIHPPVSQKEVFELQKEADVLLFLESLSNKDLTARLSFSTKLTDYFAAGKCIWAIGNHDLGPIEYIRSETAGIVSCNMKEIAIAISEIIDNTKCISDFARKAYDCGRRNHSYDLIINRLSDVINK